VFVISALLFNMMMMMMMMEAYGHIYAFADGSFFCIRK